MGSTLVDMTSHLVYLSANPVISIVGRPHTRFYGHLMYVCMYNTYIYTCLADFQEVHEDV